MGDPPRQRDWRTVLPFLVGLACCAALAVINESRGIGLWRNYAITGLLIGGTVTFLLWRYDVRVPHYILWVIVAALMLHYGGGSLASRDPYTMGAFGMHGVNGAYHVFDWWDHLTHAVGIGATAMGFAYVVDGYQYRRHLRWTTPAVWLFSVLAALAVGVGVELYEYLGKTMFRTIDQGGYSNTMMDLLYNLGGAVVGAGVATTVNRTRLEGRIRSHWTRLEPSALDHRHPWSRRLPPAMTGTLFLITIPALAATFLIVQFLFVHVPPDDSALYDRALGTLAWSAGAAVATGPAAGTLQRILERRIPSRPAEVA